MTKAFPEHVLCLATGHLGLDRDLRPLEGTLQAPQSDWIKACEPSGFPCYILIWCHLEAVLLGRCYLHYTDRHQHKSSSE